jgi:ketosteroid isomerase-like protein
MIAKIVRWRVGRAYAALAAGDAGPALKGFAENGRFIFPGDHAWAGDRQGPEAIAEWFQQFARVHPRFDLMDVIVSGAPWNLRCAIRFADRIGDDYVNEGVQYVRLRWGRIVLDRIYLDTQAVARWAEEPSDLWTA